MNGTDHKKAFGELKAKYEDQVYPDNPLHAIYNYILSVKYILSSSYVTDRRLLCPGTPDKT